MSQEYYMPNLDTLSLTTHFYDMITQTYLCFIYCMHVYNEKKSKGVCMNAYDFDFIFEMKGTSYCQIKVNLFTFCFL